MASCVKCGRKLKDCECKIDSNSALIEGLANLIIWADELQDIAEKNMKEYKAQEQQFYGTKIACIKFKQKLMELMVK
jgi:hypothetical protein